MNNRYTWKQALNMPQIDDKDTRTDVIRKSLFLDLNWFQTFSHLLVFLLLTLDM